MSLTVGVLLPSSMMFPGVDRALLDGLRGALDGAAARLVVEPTGTAAVRDVVVDKVQKLLAVERPAVVVAILGAGLVPHVRTHFEQHRTPLIVCNLGGDLQHTGGAFCPYVFWNSLSLWQSMYALGHWAAGHVGRRAALASGFHEAGYGLVHAFWSGFERAGGTVLGLEVTHKASATEDPSVAVARVLERTPDVVMGLYSGREGVSFMEAWSRSGAAGRVPLLSTPLMTHGHWLPQMDAAAARVRTACSWAPGTHPVEEARFAAAVAGERPRPAPDVFALLAYEAGLAVRHAAARVEGILDGESLRDGLAGVTFRSPRGELTFDPATGEVGTVDHLIEVVANESGAQAWSSNGALSLPSTFAEDAVEVRRQELKSGWVNAYLVN